MKEQFVLTLHIHTVVSYNYAHSNTYQAQWINAICGQDTVNNASNGLKRNVTAIFHVFCVVSFSAPSFTLCLSIFESHAYTHRSIVRNTVNASEFRNSSQFNWAGPYFGGKIMFIPLSHNKFPFSLSFKSFQVNEIFMLFFLLWFIFELFINSQTNSIKFRSFHTMYGIGSYHLQQRTFSCTMLFESNFSNE